MDMTGRLVFWFGEIYQVDCVYHRLGGMLYMVSNHYGERFTAFPEECTSCLFWRERM